MSESYECWNRDMLKDQLAGITRDTITDKDVNGLAEYLNNKLFHNPNNKWHIKKLVQKCQIDNVNVPNVGIAEMSKQLELDKLDMMFPLSLSTLIMFLKDKRCPVTVRNIRQLYFRMHAMLTTLVEEYWRKSHGNKSQESQER